MNIKHSVNLIEAYLDLERKPVGIKLFFNKEDFDKFDVPQRDRKITYCNSVQLASKGRAMKLTRENQACPNGAFALHLNPVPLPISSGKGRYSKNMYASEDIAKSIHDDMLFLKDELFGLAVMPLDLYEEEPDIVIVVSSSYNIMRLLQGNGYFYGYTNNLRTTGLQAVCQDLTTYTYNTQDINLTLLCPGTRLVADWQIDEIGIGIPFHKWYKIVEGVKETTNPFERDDKKKEIAKRLEERNLDSSALSFGKNYDDGSYSGGKIDIR